MSVSVWSKKNESQGESLAQCIASLFRLCNVDGEDFRAVGRMSVQERSESRYKKAT